MAVPVLPEIFVIPFHYPHPSAGEWSQCQQHFGIGIGIAIGFTGRRKLQDQTGARQSQFGTPITFFDVPGKSDSEEQKRANTA
jgi:hypothetical protein